MLRECAARFCHLHQAQHSFVQPRSAGSSNYDHRAALRRSIFNHPRNFLTNYRPHGCGEKTEIHYGDGHLVSIENAMPTDHRVKEAGASLVFFEPIFVASHSLKPQDVHGFQVGIHFYKRVRVAQILNSLPGGLGKVILAARPDAWVWRKLDFSRDFRSARALLKRTTRNFPLFAGVRLNCWLLENCHETYARAAVAA